LRAGRYGVNPVVESSSTIIEISQSVIRPSASAAWEGFPIGVSAKDVILKMLRRHKTDGAKGRIIEY
jgi:homoaconitase/3-isopropylmalate dehydratase large subunit